MGEGIYQSLYSGSIKGKTIMKGLCENNIQISMYAYFPSIGDVISTPVKKYVGRRYPGERIEGLL